MENVALFFMYKSTIRYCKVINFVKIVNAFPANIFFLPQELQKKQ